MHVEALSEKQRELLPLIEKFSKDYFLAVCTIKTDPEELLLITLYDPSKRPDRWTENYKKRR